MLHSNDQKQCILAMVNLLPADGMSFDLFKLCLNDEQRILAEEMTGKELVNNDGKVQAVSSTSEDNPAPSWEMTKGFVAEAFTMLTEKAEEWMGIDRKAGVTATTDLEQFSAESFNTAINNAEASSHVTCDTLLVLTAKEFRDTYLSEGADLSDDLKLEGMALQLLLESITEDDRRSVSRSNKQHYHDSIGYQLCGVLESAVTLPDIPALYRFCLYEALTEYYLRVDFGARALRCAVKQMGLVDTEGVHYWRKVYANKLLLAAYKAVRHGSDEVTAKEFEGIYRLTHVAKAQMTATPSDDGQ